MRARISLPTARLRPIPDTVSAARIVQECRAGQEVIRVGERVGRRSWRTTRHPARRLAAAVVGGPACPLSLLAFTPGTAMTAKAVQAAAGPYLTARLPPDRPAAGNPPGRAVGQGTRGACQLHFGPGSFARRAGGPSEFPVGASCGRSLPELGDDVRPAGLQRNSGNGVLVTWPGGVPARRARRQWR